MVFQVEKKYQRCVCSSACLWVNSDQWARVLSRRGFLASRDAAEAPIIPATDRNPACAQTMGSTTAASKLPADLTKGSSPPLIGTTIVWSRCVMTSTRPPNGKSAFRAVSPIGSTNLDSRSKPESARQALWVSWDKRCRTTDHLPPRYRRQCGLRGNRSPRYQQGWCPEGMTELRRLWRNLR